MRVIFMTTIDKINRELLRKGKTGAEMSREIGLSNGAYSQWNTEKTNPSKKTLLKVAEYLGVPVETLTAEDAEKKKSLLKPAGLIITICLMTRTGRFFRNGYIITQINNFYNSSLCCFVNGKDFFPSHENTHEGLRRAACP